MGLDVIERSFRLDRGGSRRALSDHLPNGPHEQQQAPQGERQDAQHRCDRPFEEGEEVALRLQHREHEIVLQYAAEDEAEDRRRHRDAVLLHEEADDPQREHDPYRHRGVGDRVGSHQRGQQDQRHQHRARYLQDEGGHHDGERAGEQHDDVGDEERAEKRADKRRVVGEDLGPRRQTLHHQDADRDRGDAVARDAEHQRRGPRTRNPGVVGRAARRDPFDGALAVHLRRPRAALGERVGDPGRHVRPGPRQCPDDGAE